MASDGAPTYEDTLAHHHLSKEDMMKECSDQFLVSVAKRLIRWQTVDLGLDRSMVKTIENGSADVEGKRVELLERWKEHFGHDATYERLARSFLRSKLANMADIVCIERKDALQNTRKAKQEMHDVAVKKKEKQCIPSTTDTTTDIQPFTETQEETGDLDGGIVDARDIPPGQLETVGPTQQTNTSPSKSLQSPPPLGVEQSSGMQEQSDSRSKTSMVASCPTPKQPSANSPTHKQPSASSPTHKQTSDTTNPSSNGKNISMIEHIDKLREERQAIEASKDEKDERLMDLMEENTKARVSVAKRDSEIKILENERKRLEDENEKTRLKERRLRIKYRVYKGAFVVVIVACLVIVAYLVISRVPINCQQLFDSQNSEL